MRLTELAFRKWKEIGRGSRRSIARDIFAGMNKQVPPITISYSPETFWRELRRVVREEMAASQSSGQHHQETPGLTVKPFYSIGELAVFFQISRATIYEWTRHGKLKPRKIRGRVYFLRSDIDQLLNQDAAE